MDRLVLSDEGNGSVEIQGNPVSFESAISMLLYFGFPGMEVQCFK